MTTATAEPQTLDDAIEVATAEENRKPVWSKRFFGISASVFANEGKNGTFYNVVVKNTYKDQDGEYRNSNSFLRDEWPIAQMLGQQAWEHVIELQSKD